MRYRKIILKGKTHYQLVLDKTPFYPEGGGQVGDTGHLENNEHQIKIFDKERKQLDRSLYKQIPSDFNPEFKAIIDFAKRLNTARNHSATHLLHHALRKVFR